MHVHPSVDEIRERVKIMNYFVVDRIAFCFEISFFTNFYFAHVFPPVYGIRQRGQVDLRLENGPGAVALAEEFSVEFH